MIFKKSFLNLTATQRAFLKCVWLFSYLLLFVIYCKPQQLALYLLNSSMIPEDLTEGKEAIYKAYACDKY